MFHGELLTFHDMLNISPLFLERLFQISGWSDTWVRHDDIRLDDFKDEKVAIEMIMPPTLS